MMKLFLAIVAIATTVSFPVWAEENDNPGNMLNPEVNQDFVSDNALIYPMRAHAEARMASRVDEPYKTLHVTRHPAFYDDSSSAN
jgi:hypothetical protein